MKQFKVKDIITPIIEFIQTCPFLEDYNIDFSDPGIQKFKEGMPDNSAIDYVGSQLLSSSKDLINNGYSARQANFNIYFLRKSGYDFYRKEFADFAWNFEQWVEYCQYNGLTPKISDNVSDQYEEMMFADNALFFGDWENHESSVYSIQLHVIYYNKYV